MPIKKQLHFVSFLRLENTILFPKWTFHNVTCITTPNISYTSCEQNVSTSYCHLRPHLIHQFSPSILDFCFLFELNSILFQLSIVTCALAVSSITISCIVGCTEHCLYQLNCTPQKHVTIVQGCWYIFNDVLYSTIGIKDFKII